MSGYQSSSMAGEMWVQWFSCCINQPAAQQVSHLRSALVASTSQKGAFTPKVMNLHLSLPSLWIVQFSASSCLKFSFLVSFLAFPFPLLFLSCIQHKEKRQCKHLTGVSVGLLGDNTVWALGRYQHFNALIVPLHISIRNISLHLHCMFIVNSTSYNYRSVLCSVLCSGLVGGHQHF